MDNFKALTQLRFWCQKVLPLVYDDSLSYYEVLCKVQQKLNDLIENNNLLPDYIMKLIRDYISSGEIEKVLADVLANYMLNVKFPPTGLTPATGDGTKDDTQAIQGCIDYAYNHGGMAVYFPSGKYLTQPLTLRNKATLFGQDRYTTQLVMRGGSTKAMFTGDVDELTLSGLGFDGNMDIQVNNVNLFDITVTSAIINNVVMTDGFTLLKVVVNKDLQLNNIIFKHAVETGAIFSGPGIIQANGLIFNSVSKLVGENYIVLNNSNSQLENVKFVGESPNGILINGNNNVVKFWNDKSLTSYVDTGLNNSITVYNKEISEKVSGAVSIKADEFKIDVVKPIDYKNPDPLNEYFKTIPFKHGTNNYKVLVLGEKDLPHELDLIKLSVVAVDEKLTSEINNVDTQLNGKIDTVSNNVNNLSNEVADIKTKFLLNVKNFGAKGDGITNDTDAIQACLNAIATNKDKTISGAVFPNGHYLIDSINVPAGVEIIGNFSMDSVNLTGTWLYCQDMTKNAVILNNGSSLKNMSFYYPKQSWSTANNAPSIAYPYAIKTTLHARRMLIENVCFLNAYNGIDASLAHELLFMNNIQGYCINNGIVIAETTDIDRFNTIHFNHNILVNNGDVNSAKYRDWTRTNGTAFIIRKSDWIVCNDLFCWGYRTGMLLESSESGGVAGAHFNYCGFDNCGVCIRAKATAPAYNWGLYFNNCFFVGFNQIYPNTETDNAVIIRNTMDVTFNKCRFWAGEKTAIDCASDYTIIDGCTFEAWGRYGTVDDPSRAILIQNSMAVIVNNILYGRQAKGIQGVCLINVTKGANVSNNVFNDFVADSFAIAYISGSRLQIRANNFNNVVDKLNNTLVQNSICEVDDKVYVDNVLYSKNHSFKKGTDNSSNNSLFVDETGVLKFKNDAGVVKTVTLA